MQIMIHDDDCGEYLDKNGMCPKCKFHPDLQSLALVETDINTIERYLSAGFTMMGLYRRPITVRTLYLLLSF